MAQGTFGQAMCNSLLVIDDNPRPICAAETMHSRCDRIFRCLNLGVWLSSRFYAMINR